MQNCFLSWNHLTTCIRAVPWGFPFPFPEHVLSSSLCRTISLGLILSDGTMWCGCDLSSGFISRHRGMQVYQSLWGQRVDFPTVEQRLWSRHCRVDYRDYRIAPTCSCGGIFGNWPLRGKLWYLALHVVTIDMGLCVWVFCARETAYPGHREWFCRIAGLP